MCPDRKLEWFKNNDFTRDDIRHLKAAVVAHWAKKYGSDVTTAEVDDTQQKGKVCSLLSHYDCV